MANVLHIIIHYFNQLLFEDSVHITIFQMPISHRYSCFLKFEI